MKYLTFDFETSDPYIGLGLGAGWVYKPNEQTEFKPLCCGYRTHEGEFGITNDWDKLRQLVINHDILIAHNAMYDCGALVYLGIGLKDKIIVDTVVLSKLFRNNSLNHHLEFLAKTYLKEKKTSGTLGDAIWEANLYPWTKLDINKLKRNPEFIRKKPIQKKLNDWAYANMEETYTNCKKVVEDYCIQDVNICWQLFVKFGGEHQPKDQQLLYSNCLKALMKMRHKGIRIDLDRAREVHQILVPKIAQAYKKCFDIAGSEFNLYSCKEVPKIFDALHIKYPRNAKGNPNIDSAFLDTCTHPMAEALKFARKVNKLDKDFIQKVISLQTTVLGLSEEEVNITKYGRIHPTIVLFGASKTGRFSSSEPNIQQIPKHDKEFAPLIRSIFVPEEGETWYKLDYSNQEGRIQLHFAKKLECEGVNVLLEAYRENPKLDMHQRVADMAGITRDQAKTITHGIGFGMGVKKLGEALKVSELAGKEIIANFHEKIPYVQDFMKKCIKAMESKGYIFTLLKRKLFDDKFDKDGKEVSLAYRAISKVIQGSAADQTILALNEAYLNNIPVLCIVHDEFNISCIDPVEAMKMGGIMRTCVELEVPVEVDTTYGSNWGEASFPPSNPVDKPNQTMLN